MKAEICQILRPLLSVAFVAVAMTGSQAIGQEYPAVSIEEFTKKLGPDQSEKSHRWAIEICDHVIGDPNVVVQALVEYVRRESDSSLRPWAAESILRLIDQSGVQESLTQEAKRTAVEILREAVQENGPAKLSAAVSLARLGSKDEVVVFALLEGIRTGTPYSGASSALRLVGNDFARAKLIELAHSPDMTERRNAIHTLADFRGDEVIALIASACSDPAVQVRTTAIRAIGSRNVPDEIAATALQKHILAPEREVQVAAVNALQAYCEDARSAVPMLIDMLGHRDASHCRLGLFADVDSGAGGNANATERSAGQGTLGALLVRNGVVRAARTIIGCCLSTSKDC